MKIQKAKLGPSVKNKSKYNELSQASKPNGGEEIVAGDLKL